MAQDHSDDLTHGYQQAHVREELTRMAKTGSIRVMRSNDGTVIHAYANDYAQYMLEELGINSDKLSKAKKAVLGKNYTLDDCRLEIDMASLSEAIGGSDHLQEVFDEKGYELQTKSREVG